MAVGAGLGGRSPRWTVASGDVTVSRNRRHPGRTLPRQLFGIVTVAAIVIVGVASALIMLTATRRPPIESPGPSAERARRRAPTGRGFGALDALFEVPQLPVALRNGRAPPGTAPGDAGPLRLTASARLPDTKGTAAGATCSTLVTAGEGCRAASTSILKYETAVPLRPGGIHWRSSGPVWIQRARQGPQLATPPGGQLGTRAPAGCRPTSLGLSRRRRGMPERRGRSRRRRLGGLCPTPDRRWWPIPVGLDVPVFAGRSHRWRRGLRAQGPRHVERCEHEAEQTIRP